MSLKLKKGLLYFLYLIMGIFLYSVGVEYLQALKKQAFQDFNLDRYLIFHPVFSIFLGMYLGLPSLVRKWTSFRNIAVDKVKLLFVFLPSFIFIVFFWLVHFGVFNLWDFTWVYYTFAFFDINLFGLFIGYFFMDMFVFHTEDP